ncbi:unnamed protein product [Clonostachys solani]|uniref:Vegetative incompatibility protein HET-E-1 n=1 Tax=Clonostachys solani TaxID=160281 RepID=A0A9N9ZIR2_9HYPO|nr:unnamed protein product [Clonostachys solani]
MAASEAMLDETHVSLSRVSSDDNSYTFGRIGAHNIAMACLPAGGTGKTSAARVASNMQRTFTNLRLGLMVGIGGAAPSQARDIRLGDVVISHPNATSGGVIQYDFGKSVQGGRFVQTGTLNKPPRVLMTAVSQLQAKYQREGSGLSRSLLQMTARYPNMTAFYSHPGVDSDILYEALYDHPEGNTTCLECDPSRIVQRPNRPSEDPVIHLGLIASGDRVMRDGATRDRLQREKQVDCFEMEAAGLMDDFPCLVIRGICDYSDSHKNKAWQPYAASTAAAYAKDLLHTLETSKHDDASSDVDLDREDKATAQACLGDLFQTDPVVDRDTLKRKKGGRANGTCEWILDSDEIVGWLDPEQRGGAVTEMSNVLWLHGHPGTGKSTVAIFLTEQLSIEFSSTDSKTLGYFFCDSGFDTRKTATSVIRGLLWQLLKKYPRLIHEYVLPKYTQSNKENRGKLFDSFDVMWPMFIAAAADNETGQKYFIIDALDECDEESQATLLRQFDQTFSCHNNIENVHILITSRPYPEIGEYLERFTNKDLGSFPQRQQDIERFIKETVAELSRRKSYTPKVREQVSSILKLKAEGTFLWVGLACKELEQVLSRHAIRVLQQLPKGLYPLYQELLNKARGENDVNSDTVQCIMSCVAVALRPLTVGELSDACHLHLEEEDVETRLQYTQDDIASCRLMVIVQDQEVLLLHQSVKDYLIGGGSHFFVKELDAHARLAYRCVDIASRSLRDDRRVLGNFREYSMKNWPNHARMARSSFDIKHSRAEFFSATSESRERWLEYLRSENWTNNHSVAYRFSLLHVAGRWGISCLVNHFFALHGRSDFDREPDCIDAAGQTPLQWAVRSGYVDVITVLLSRGAKLTPGVLALAVSNQEKGPEIMASLVGQMTEKVAITKEVVEAVAGNTRSGRETMSELFKRRTEFITITEETVSSVAKWLDGEVMVMVLDQNKENTLITGEVVKAARSNETSGKNVMSTLLKSHRRKAVITEETILSVARSFDKEIMRTLMDQLGREMVISEEIFVAAAENCWYGREVMALLLEQADHLVVTEDIVQAAAGNYWSGREVLILLLDSPADWHNTKMRTLAKSFGREVMPLLLERRGDHTTTNETATSMTSENYWGRMLASMLPMIPLMEENGTRSTAGNQSLDQQDHPAKLEIDTCTWSLNDGPSITPDASKNGPHQTSLSISKPQINGQDTTTCVGLSHIYPPVMHDKEDNAGPKRRRLTPRLCDSVQTAHVRGLPIMQKGFSGSPSSTYDLQEKAFFYVKTIILSRIFVDKGRGNPNMRILLPPSTMR